MAGGPLRGRNPNPRRGRGRARRTPISHTHLVPGVPRVVRVPGPGSGTGDGNRLGPRGPHGCPQLAPLDEPGTSDAPFADAETIRLAPR
eukprot:scaffold39500_cov48-Phaeocystis_antarctica.AAC.2